MKKLIFLLALMLPLTFAFTGNTDGCASCSTPDNVTKTSETSSTMSFSWNAVTGADEYVLRYVPQGQAGSADIIVSGTSYTFTGLSAGTYSFYFSARCGETTSLPFIVIDDVAGG